MIYKISQEWIYVYAKFIKLKRKLTADGHGGTQRFQLNVMLGGCGIQIPNFPSF